MENKLILETRKYKAGYEVRTELHVINFDAKYLHKGKNKEAHMLAKYINEHKGDIVIIKSAYTPSGDYIGNQKTAYFICKKRGIKPEKARSSHKVCSIGFCENEQKWYGWSHRAIFGFGIGSVAEEGDCCTTTGYIDSYIKRHPEEDLSVPVGFEAKTLDDAKRMAIAFADSVG